MFACSCSQDAPGYCRIAFAKTPAPVALSVAPVAVKILNHWLASQILARGVPYACTNSPFVSFLLYRSRGFLFLPAPASFVNLPSTEVPVDPSPGFKIYAFIPVFAFAFVPPFSSSPWEDLANAGQVVIAQFFISQVVTPCMSWSYTCTHTHTSLTAHVS